MEAAVRLRPSAYKCDWWSDSQRFWMHNCSIFSQLMIVNTCANASIMIKDSSIYIKSKYGAFNFDVKLACLHAYVFPACRHPYPCKKACWININQYQQCRGMHKRHFLAAAMTQQLFLPLISSSDNCKNGARWCKSIALWYHKSSERLKERPFYPPSTGRPWKWVCRNMLPSGWYAFSAIIVLHYSLTPKILQ